MSCYTLVYTSVANQKMSDEHLKALLKKARKKNEQLNITGMLLYLDPYFIQVLEGEEATISGVFDTIKEDKRHDKVSIIYKKPAEERCFDNWTMGFNKVENENMAAIDGFSEFLQQPNQDFFKKSPNRVTELLHMFKKEILF
jgi:Sensors of blue-light using FAD